MNEAVMSLLERQMLLYTMGEHSSLPVETVEELARSIAFTIEQCQGEAGELMAPAPAPEALLAQGRRVLEREVSRGRMLLRGVEAGAPAFAGRSYRGTLAEIHGFFRAYDLRFFAHQIPCLIDYQLAQAVPAELLGVRFINEYLRRLACENAVCARFDPARADKLLREQDSLYTQEVTNLYEPLAERALALALLGGDIHGLALTEGQRAALRERLAAGERLTGAAGRLARALELSGMQRAYLERTAEAMETRLRAAFQLKML